MQPSFAPFVELVTRGGFGRSLGEEAGEADWVWGKVFCLEIRKSQSSHVVQWARIHFPMQETWVRSLGQEDTLGKEMAVKENLLQFPAWKIPWTEKPGRLQSMELQRTVHDQATEYACTYHCRIILCSLAINEKESKTKNPSCLLNEMLWKQIITQSILWT